MAKTSKPSLEKTDSKVEPSTTCETCGRLFEPRSRGGRYCSLKCAGVGIAKPGVGESLLDIFPEIAAEADGWDPAQVRSRAKGIRSWKCAQGHRWETAVVNRSRGGVARGCPYCAGVYPVFGKTDLATTHPEIAAEADGWDPTTVLPGSSKNKNWKCNYGHVWQATVVNRTDKGTGCPFCSGRHAIPGVTDLATINPELAAQADGWDPSAVAAYSHRKLTWRCEVGHTWEARVAERSSGNGCPFCSGHQVLFGFNDLLTINPELAAQADGWDPTTLSAFSNKKVGWICGVGHSWYTSVGNRSKGSGCPVCSGRVPNVGVNDLSTTDPELAIQANGWDPTTVSQGSDKKVEWKCELGHIWQARVSERSSGNGCPVCANRTVLVGFNDLVATNPELAAQADGWDPTTVVAHSGKNLKWKCDLGHSWTTSVDNRSKGTSCPFCTNRTVLVGFNDLVATNPELAAQADGWDPTTVVGYSNKSVGWICEFDHQWRATVASRSAGNGCPFCSGHQVLVGFNDITTTNPELAAQADGWDPTTLSAFSNKKVGWICELGHSWQAMVGSRTRGNGCPVCSGRKVLQGYNDLATLSPELAAQADGWDPTAVTSQTHKKADWVCVIGHRWKATVKNRFRSTGCPICSNKQLLVGFNDLASTNPALASQADGWDPSTVFANTNNKLSWRCAENHTWKASPNGRSRGSGCPYCAIYGFNPGRDGWLYLIDNDALDMFQIGISNVPENRLDRHARGGWEVIEVRGPMDGFLTQELERSSLMALKRRGAILGRKGSLEKFDGHTEAWTKESLQVTSIKQLLDWVYEDESQ